MLELVLIILKYIYRLYLRGLCSLIYINHNYYITDLSVPYRGGFIAENNLKYYDFELTYKCKLCGKVRKKLYYRDLKQWGRGIEESEITLIADKIEKSNNLFFVKLENDNNKYALKYLFQHSGIYKMKNVSAELKTYIDSFNYVTTKRCNEYLYIAVYVEKYSKIKQIIRYE